MPFLFLLSPMLLFVQDTKLPLLCFYLPWVVELCRSNSSNFPEEQSEFDFWVWSFFWGPFSLPFSVCVCVGVSWGWWMMMNATVGLVCLFGKRRKRKYIFLWKRRKKISLYVEGEWNFLYSNALHPNVGPCYCWMKKAFFFFFGFLFIFLGERWS